MKYNRFYRYAVTLIEVLVVCGGIALLVGLLGPAVQRVRATANQTSCANNLHQIGLVLDQFHDSNGELPPATLHRLNAQDRYLNWHARILPYLEQDALAEITRVDFVLNPYVFRSPRHRNHSNPVPVYQCPSDPRKGVIGNNGINEVAITDYLGNSGLPSANFILGLADTWPSLTISGTLGFIKYRVMGLYILSLLSDFLKSGMLRVTPFSSGKVPHQTIA